MEFREVVRRRRMVRRFDPDRPVDREAVVRALQTAIHAPSAGFTQGWDFVVLDTPEQRRRFWAATADREQDSWMRGVSAAPVLIVCCSPEAYLDRYAEPDKGWTDRDLRRWPIPYWDVDTGMAALSCCSRPSTRASGPSSSAFRRPRTARSGVPSAYRPHTVWSASSPWGTRRSGSPVPACARAARGRRRGALGVFGESAPGPDGA